jgi:copper chaperone NosL
MNKRVTIFARIATLVAALLLIGVLIWPIWRIELSAPQYPEGLVLKIYANKLGGNVDVVNGLNHYIGMRTLHEKDFFEFSILPWVIGAFILFGFLSVLINRKWFLFTWIACYLVFAIVAMVDFYHWEYNYGHNLDPSAPIQVPGMAYQPPLIGFKQLLNFGAYSIPDAGGWIFIGVGVLLAVLMIREIRVAKTTSSRLPLSVAAVTTICLCLYGCTTQPQPIRFGSDACDFCKMTILDHRFGGEVITKKGRVYKFDDVHCIASFLKSNITANDVANVYLLNYTAGNFIKASDSYLLQSENLHSPMGGNTAAFISEQALQPVKQQVQGVIKKWNELSQ